MTALRLYFDADSMERAVVLGLRARGIDVTTALEAGITDRTDEEQLEFATSQGRALFSFNASDFSRIHTEFLSQGKSHSGIILAPQQRYSVGERIRRLLRLISARSAEQMHNGVEYLSNWG
jgi:hypothetical protein